jgi:hypothetical protein
MVSMQDRCRKALYVGMLAAAWVCGVRGGHGGDAVGVLEYRHV